MKIKMFSKKMMFGGLLILAAASIQAGTLTGVAISFDPQGTAGTNKQQVSAFDWAVNGLLNTAGDTTPEGRVIPFVPGQTKDLQVYYHAALQGISAPSGNPASLPGLNISYEITVVAGVGAVGDLPDGETTLQFTPITTDNNYENFFRIYIGALNSDSVPGTGYSDGTLILEGVFVDLAASYANSDLPDDLAKLPRFDGFGNNDWEGTTSVIGQGGQTVEVLVTMADPDYFVEGMAPGSIIPFSTQNVLPFLQGNPSYSFDTEAGSISPDVGNRNGIDGPDLMEQIDANNAFVSIEDVALGCRVTGGGNDTSGLLDGGETAGHDGTVAEGGILEQAKGSSKGNKKTGYTQWWTMGGQAGANTGKQPQPKGEWQHQNHGDMGEWGFHGGTASALPGTEIDVIVCSDEDWCRQARPAPTKQIDFAGVGNFHNLRGKKNTEKLIPDLPFDATTQSTYHWFEVHIEDLGEPGNIAQAENVGTDMCLLGGSGTDAFAGVPFASAPVFVDASCDCPDFYRIRIYAATDAPPGSGDFNDDGSLHKDYIDGLKAQKDLDFYEAAGYINGGNFQIHPLTGFDLK